MTRNHDQAAESIAVVVVVFAVVATAYFWKKEPRQGEGSGKKDYPMGGLANSREVLLIGGTTPLRHLQRGEVLLMGGTTPLCHLQRGVRMQPIQQSSLRLGH